MSWYFSPKKEKILIITGTDADITQTEPDIKSKIANFEIKFKVVFLLCHYMTIPLGGKIRDGSCKAPGTCQFMLSAIDASSAAENRKVYFAATALHIFMEEGVVEDLDTGRLTEQNYLQRLNQVQENFEAPRLRAKRLNVNPPSPLNESLALRLTDSPLYAYRTHADRYCDFMSDLILLEFFSDTVNNYS